MSERKDYWCCAADFGKHEPTCRNYVTDERSAPAPDPVRDLIAKWHKRADLPVTGMELTRGDLGSSAYAERRWLRECADELEAALAATPTAPQPADASDFTAALDLQRQISLRSKDETAVAIIAEWLAAHRNQK